MLHSFMAEKSDTEPNGALETDKAALDSLLLPIVLRISGVKKAITETKGS